ncbi:MAG: M28 family peptidase [Phycisphaerales bacterium JB043]
MRAFIAALCLVVAASQTSSHLAQLSEHEQTLLALPDSDSLRSWHTMMASEPHRAATPGDLALIERMSSELESMGLEVEVHEFWALLPQPVSASLTILGDEPVELDLREQPLDEDEFSQDPDLSIGWNAYSASGAAEGRVVYANRGTKEDFEHLRELGIDCTGAIVIARYGGNFRGYKAKFAQEAGAAGLIIFTDPGDSGYAQGPMYPEGGWANPTSIQRGSIMTLPYRGDPLTPFIEATEDAQRLDPDAIDLPRIPVQPIGWGAAQQILKRMTGLPVERRSWQGGLPLVYRITGGDELRVRLEVEQERTIARTANVIATLRGSENPDQRVIVGCHHDAWEYGAQDPTSGLMVVFEAARVLSQLRDEGWTPKRSISFAAWGAEEYGIIGSSEWVEKHHDDLARNALAYINLDGAASGTRFGASASPSLKPLIIEIANLVDDIEGMGQGSVFDRWIQEAHNESTPGIPRIGLLGGGSDHVGLYCHVGVPSCGLGFRGAKGTAYHSNYDTLAWYRKVMDDSYEPARTLTQLVSLMLARLADDDVLPINADRFGPDITHHIETLASLAEQHGLSLTSETLLASVAALAIQSERTSAALDANAPTLDPETLDAINQLLISLERIWLDREGLPGRPWYRNTFASTDPYSGYASWALPALRDAIENNDQESLDRALGDLRSRVEALRAGLRSLEALATTEK